MGLGTEGVEFQRLFLYGDFYLEDYEIATTKSYLLTILKKLGAKGGQVVEFLRKYVISLAVFCVPVQLWATGLPESMTSGIEGFVPASEISTVEDSALRNLAQTRKRYENALHARSLDGLGLSPQLKDFVLGRSDVPDQHSPLAHLADEQERIDHFLRAALLAVFFMEAISESASSAIGPGSITDAYNAGNKHIVSLKLPFGVETPIIGIDFGQVAFLMDLDDILQITGEGQDNWVTYWLDASLGFSVGIPGLPYVGAFAIERTPEVDDPLRRLRFTGFSADLIGFDIQFASVSHDGSSVFEYGGYAPTTSLGGLTAMETSASLLRGEIDRDLLLFTIGSALMPASGLVYWTPVVHDLLDATFNGVGLFSYFTGVVQPQMHRRLTASDNPGSLGSGSPFTETLLRARGGFDVDGDSWPDNVYAPSGSGMTPTSFQSMNVNFMSHDTQQRDYRVSVGDVPSGWSIVAEHADGSQAGDHFSVFSAYPHTNYGTIWQVGCTENAPSPVEIEFVLQRRHFPFIYSEIDGAVETFVCEDFVPELPPDTYTLTIQKAGSAVEGVISSSQLGTVCDAGCTSTSVSVSANSSVQLNATPGVDVDFIGWGGDCSGSASCSLSMTENRSVTAAFDTQGSGGESPSPPYSLVANATGHDRIALSWQADSSNTHGFRVQRRHSSTGNWYQIKSLPASARTFTNVSLDAASTYSYRIHSHNEYGNSSHSNTASATTQSNAPNAPASLNGWAISSTRVAMSWTDTNNGTASFQVEASPDGQNWSLVAYLSSSTTNYVRSVSTNSTNYFRVRAYNAATGYSPYSSVIQIHACAPPDEPWLHRPLSGQGSQPLDLTFEWRGDDQVASWDLYLADSEELELYEADIDNPDPGVSMEHDVFGLEPGTTYHWTVVAHSSCNANFSTPGRIRTFRTEGAPDPAELVSPPDTATGLPTSLVLDWRNVTSLGTVLYELHLGETSPPEFHAETITRTELLVENLEPETTYYWQVVARSEPNPEFYSESEIWSFTTGQGTTTTITLEPTDDAGLRGPPHGHRNYGGDPDADAEQNVLILGRDNNWYVDPGAADTRGAIRFDLSDIPAGSTIHNATISMPWLASYGPGLSEPLTMTFTPYTGSWSEQTVTWNNRPGINSNAMIVGERPLSGFNPTDNDLTPLVQQWVDGALSNHGLEIAIPEWEGTSGNYHQVFAQKELPNTDPPVLRVTYGEPCVAPPVPSGPSPEHGASGIGSPVTLSWAEIDDVAGYDLIFGTPGNLHNIGLTTETSITVDSLLPNQDYSWRVEARAACDPSITSLSSTWTFTTDACVDLTPVEVIAPENQMDSAPRNISLEWEPVQGASHYEVLLGTSAPPVSVVATQADPIAMVSLQPATQYYWQIRAIPECDTAESSVSNMRMIETAIGPSANAGESMMIPPNTPTSVGGAPSAQYGTPPYEYTWSINPTEGASLSALDVANPIFEAQIADIYTLTLVVEDSKGFVSNPSTVLIAIDPIVFRDAFEQ